MTLIETIHRERSTTLILVTHSEEIAHRARRRLDHEPRQDPGRPGLTAAPGVHDNFRLPPSTAQGFLDGEQICRATV